MWMVLGLNNITPHTDMSTNIFWFDQLFLKEIIPISFEFKQDIEYIYMIDIICCWEIIHYKLLNNDVFDCQKIYPQYLIQNQLLKSVPARSLWKLRV